MKKVFAGLVCAFIVLFTMAPFSFASSSVQYNFPEPDGGLEFVLGTSRSLRVYKFFLPEELQYNLHTDSNGNTTGTSYPAIEAYLHYSNAKITFWFMSAIDNLEITGYICNYSINGDLLGTSSLKILASNNVTSFSLDNVSYIETEGIYTKGFLLDDSFSNIPRLNATFSDARDYKSHFEALQTVSIMIQQAINNLYSQDHSYYAIVSEFIDWFMDNEPDYSVHNWAYYVEKMDSFSYNMTIFARDFNDWYQRYYIPKTDQTNQILQDIYDLLGGGIEQTTVPPESIMSEAVSDYVEGEEQLLSAYNYESSVESNFAVANDIFNSGSNGIGGAFSFIMDRLSFILGMPLIPILVIFSLSMGIVVFILGKKVG